MNKIPCILALFFCMLAPAARGAPNSMGIAAGVAKTITAEDVSLTISVDQNSPTVAFPLRLKLTNHRAEPISVLVSGGVPCCIITIKNDKGEPCAYTNAGKSKFEIRVARSVRFLDIPSGAFKEWTIPLESYFKLETGTMTLNLTAYFAHGADAVTSGTPDQQKHIDVTGLQFQIVEEK